MKAAIVPAVNEKWEVKEVPNLEPGPNQVLKDPRQWPVLHRRSPDQGGTAWRVQQQNESLESLGEPRPRLTDDQVVRLYDAIKEELLLDQNLEIILKSSPEDLASMDSVKDLSYRKKNKLVQKNRVCPTRSTWNLR